MYSIRLTSSAEKQLDVLTTSLFRRIDAKILTLAGEPRPSGCKKLRGRIGTWRIRIGNYRVLYEVDDSKKQVTILACSQEKKLTDNPLKLDPRMAELHRFDQSRRSSVRFSFARIAFQVREQKPATGAQRFDDRRRRVFGRSGVEGRLWIVLDPELYRLRNVFAAFEANQR